MALDLGEATLQIDRMVAELRSRRRDRDDRLARAVSALRGFSVADYDAALEQLGDSAGRPTPRISQHPAAAFDPATLPADISVVSADGSHIDADRNLPVRCFLINCGIAALTYGANANARLYSESRLYARDDEMVLRDPVSYREQQIEGPVLGAKRTVEEAQALVKAVGELPTATPTVGLLDGSLVMMGLVGSINQPYVIRELVEEGFAAALEELRLIAESRDLTVGSYISMPAHTEVAGALRVTSCDYGAEDPGYRCGPSGSGRVPCGSCVGGVRDRDLFSAVLEPGQRSAVFASSAAIVTQYYGRSAVHFFYVNTGLEIGRVEVPAWVAEDDRRLELTHSVIIEQCRLGQGYPVALMEAHEQAAVSGSDRRLFVQQLESALTEQRLPVYTSEKARSKRVRAL